MAWRPDDRRHLLCLRRVRGYLLRDGYLEPQRLRLRRHRSRGESQGLRLLHPDEERSHLGAHHRERDGQRHLGHLDEHLGHPDEHPAHREHR